MVMAIFFDLDKLTMAEEFLLNKNKQQVGEEENY